MDPAWYLRPARPEDVPAIIDLVRELADYERAPDAVRLDADRLSAALWGSGAVAGADVAEVGGEVVGTAVWFCTFSTWTGTAGIHLEDLYVRPAARRLGIGRALLAGLARRCVERGWERLEWAVLDWNSPAQAFYGSLGSAALDGWTTWRLEGAPLRALGGA